MPPADLVAGLPLDPPAAQKEVERARAHAEAQRQRQRDFQARPRPGARAPDFATDIRLAEAFEHRAAEQLAQCQQGQKQALRGLADNCHPFDAGHGQPVTAAAEVAAARLGEGSTEAVAKARRWLMSLVASLPEKALPPRRRGGRIDDHSPGWAGSQ